MDTVLCEGETLSIGGITYDETGIYASTYPSSLGCDSLVITTLIIGEVYEEYKEVRICEDEYHEEGTSTYREAGTYYDLYTTQYGCDSMVVTELDVVKCSCFVFAPNAVTADGDLINDSFKVEFDCDFEDYELMIFNRWGVKIFSSNDPETVWIPSSESSEYYAPDGIYSYRLQYSYIDRKTNLPVGPVRKTGSITVLR